MKERLLTLICILFLITGRIHAQQEEGIIENEQQLEKLILQIMILVVASISFLMA